MILLYDGTFEGFLTAVFNCYQDKIIPINISYLKNYQESVFDEKTMIAADAEKADRVWQGLQKKLGSETKQLPFLAFLSGETGIEMCLYRFMRLAFDSPVPVEGNFSDPDILFVRKAARRVMKEARRMLQFIRFQRTRDDIYFAPVSPDYDVIFMILQHFIDRFTDQKWLIYDLRRDYGFFYDLQHATEVKLNEKSFHALNGTVQPGYLHEGEAHYQSMWKDYCKEITIRERLNLKLQRQHMPRRYWKFLPEKF